MFFILLTFAAALFIEGLGSVVSVIGISKLFGVNPLIIALAIALDVGKIVVVSLLYTYWKQLSFLMKSYALTAATITMIITSAGAAGYLSGEFQKAIIGTKEGELNVSVLKEQQTRLLERKKQIDDQIAKLPSNYSRARIALMRQFEGEQKAVRDQLASIDKQLPEAQLKQIGTEAKAGPILYVAKAFDVSVEQAVKWVILLIIFVFDPLAIFLIVAGNFLWAHRKKGDPTRPFEPPEEAVLPADDDTELNTYHVAPDGTIIRPEVPPFMKDEHAEYVAEQLKVTGGKKSWPFDPAADPRGHEIYQPMITELTPTPKQKPPLEEKGTWSEDFTFHPATKEPLQESSLEEKLAKFTPEMQGEVAPVVPIGKEFPTQEDAAPTDDRRYVPTGLLKPIDVRRDDDRSDEFPDPVPPPTGPIPTGTELPPQTRRDEVVRSSLGPVVPDPKTIVDAHRVEGFKKAQAVVTTPPKRPNHDEDV